MGEQKGSLTNALIALAIFGGIFASVKIFFPEIMTQIGDGIKGITTGIFDSIGLINPFLHL